MSYLKISIIVFCVLMIGFSFFLKRNNRISSIRLIGYFIFWSSSAFVVAFFQDFMNKLKWFTAIDKPLLAFLTIGVTIVVVKYFFLELNLKQSDRKIQKLISENALLVNQVKKIRDRLES